MNKGVYLRKDRWLAMLFHMQASGTTHKTSLPPHPSALLAKQESWRCSEHPLGRVGQWQVLKASKSLAFEGHLGKEMTIQAGKLNYVVINPQETAIFSLLPHALPSY